MRISRVLKRNIQENTPFLSELFFYKIFLLGANLKLAQKGFVSSHFKYNNNSYFPHIFSILNPFYLNFFAILLLLAPIRTLNFLAVVIAWALMIHPNTIGVQHYVTIFWTGLWLVQYDRSENSIWIGKLTCSVMFFCAAIGKLSEGWWSGSYVESLTWTHSYPYKLLGPSAFSKLAIICELLLGASFLIPSTLGLTIALLLISGMFLTISMEVFDALGPVCGMLLSLLTYEFSRRTEVLTIFNEGSPKTKRRIKTITTNVLVVNYENHSEMREQSKSFLAKNESGNFFSGLETYIELLRRTPILLPLYPFLRIKCIYRFGSKVYSGKLRD